jgi:hypothetical protein
LGRKRKTGKVIGFYTDDDGTVHPITAPKGKRIKWKFMKGKLDIVGADIEKDKLKVRVPTEDGGTVERELELKRHPSPYATVAKENGGGGAPKMKLIKTYNLNINNPDKEIEKECRLEYEKIDAQVSVIGAEIQVEFKKIPTEDVRDELKKRGFKWSPTSKKWVKTLAPPLRKDLVIQKHPQAANEARELVNLFGKGRVMVYIGEPFTPNVKVEIYNYE